LQLNGLANMRVPLLMLLMLVGGAWSAAAQPAQSSQTGQGLYISACATCHGADGRGAPRSSVAFDDPLPDFTDCSFATREPDADWLAVVHDGGPARAFGRMMPAFAGALTLEQMQLVVSHMRTLCASRAWPRGELNFPRPLVTEKAFPEDEVVISTQIDTEGNAPVSNKFVYERRLGARNQIEAIVPFTADGIGDIAVGGKRAIFHSFERGTIVSVAGEAILPTGDEAAGLTKNTMLFEPFISFGQALPGEGFIQAQAGAELPADRDKATPEAFWRFVVGRSFSQQQWGRSWSPMIEVLAARELKTGEHSLWDVAPQLQVTLSTRQHIMASAGVRLPVNRRDDRDTQVLFYVLWDWFDGPLFGGW
jgi:mono/diheme cytochrome c family protein